MKKIVILLTIIVILPLFTLISHAEGEAEEYISEFENLLPEGYEGASDIESLSSSTSVKALFSELISAIQGQAGGAMGFLALLLGCIALSALASRVNDKMREGTTLAVGIISSLVIFGRIRPLFDEISASLSSLSGFFSSLIPLTAAITAMGVAIYVYPGTMTSSPGPTPRATSALVNAA